MRDSNLQARLQSLLACVKRRCDGSQDLDAARPAAAEEAEERQKQLDESLKEMVRHFIFNFALLMCDWCSATFSPPSMTSRATRRCPTPRPTRTQRRRPSRASRSPCQVRGVLFMYLFIYHMVAALSVPTVAASMAPYMTAGWSLAFLAILIRVLESVPV